MESEGSMDKTFRVSQLQIKEAVDLQSRDKVCCLCSETNPKIFDLNLNEFGPYSAEYTKDGRFILLAGQKGHVLFKLDINLCRTHFSFRLEQK